MSVVVLLLPLVHMWLYHYDFLSELGENGFDIREENGREVLHTSYTVLTEVKLFCAWLASELENQLKCHSF